eukprot:scaffold344_cov178-Ochromonas_danica.AAC.14
MESFPVTDALLENPTTKLDYRSYCPAIRSIELERLSFICSRNLEERLYLFLRECTHLEGVTCLGSADNDAIFSALRRGIKPNTLQSICINLCECSSISASTVNVIREFLANHLSSMRDLELWHPIDVEYSDEILSILYEKKPCTRLRSLKQSTKLVPMMKLLDIYEALPSLISFRCVDPYNYLPKDKMDLLRQYDEWVLFKSKLSLYLTDLEGYMSESILIEAVKELPRLEKLSTSFGRETFSDLSLTALIEYAPGLKAIFIGNMQESEQCSFSDEMISKLIESCKLLEYVSVPRAGCKSVLAVKHHLRLEDIHFDDVNVTIEEMASILLDEREGEEKSIWRLHTGTIYCKNRSFSFDKAARCWKLRH